MRDGAREMHFAVKNGFSSRPAYSPSPTVIELGAERTTVVGDAGDDALLQREKEIYILVCRSMLRRPLPAGKDTVLVHLSRHSDR